MVTLTPVPPPEVGVKKVVPDELLESSSVAGVAPLVTTLPNWSCAWTAKGPTLAVALTGWLPVTVEVKTSLVGAPPPW